MQIKILGPGCRNCNNLEKATRAALVATGIEATVEHVTNYADIAAYGILKTPGLVIDEQVVVSGRVPSSAEITGLLVEHRR